MNDDRARKLMGGAAIATAAGTFLPWAQVLFVSVSGIDTDRGLVALAAALIGGGLLCWQRAPRWLQLVTSTIAGGAAVWLIADVSGKGAAVAVGSGAYLTTIASLAWLVIACASLRSRRAQRALAPA